MIAAMIAWSTSAYAQLPPGQGAPYGGFQAYGQGVVQPAPDIRSVPGPQYTPVIPAAFPQSMNQGGVVNGNYVDPNSGYFDGENGAYRGFDPAYSNAPTEVQNAIYDPYRNIFFRVGYIAGEQIGDRDPYGSVAASKYYFAGDHLFMHDYRLHVNNDGKLSGNIGGVLRGLHGDNVLGVGMWYDITQSDNEQVYQGLGASFEWLRTDWRIRSNLYFPIGDRSKIIQRNIAGNYGSGPYIQPDHYLVSGGTMEETLEAALTGGEIEFGHTIPALHGLEAFLGGYYYRESPFDAGGVKTGLKGFIHPQVAGTLTFSYDNRFDGNIFGGLTWFLGGSGQESRNTLEGQWSAIVNRNDQMVLDREVRYMSDYVEYTHPVSGERISVSVVSGTGQFGGDGSLTNPYGSLTDANASDDTIIYLAADSTYVDQSILLGPYQQLRGDSSVSTQTVMTAQGNVVLPPINAAGVNRPVIQDTLGGNQMVTLTTENVVSGIEFDGNLTGFSGIVGGGGTNHLIEQSFMHDFLNAAISITPSNGTTIQNMMYSNNGVDTVLNANNTTIANTVSANSTIGIQLSNVTGFATLSNIVMTGIEDTGLQINNIIPSAVGSPTPTTVNVTDTSIAGSGSASTGILVNNPVGGGNPSVINFNRFQVSTFATGVAVNNFSTGSSATVNFMDSTNAAAGAPPFPTTNVTGTTGDAFAFSDVNVNMTNISIGSVFGDGVQNTSTSLNLPSTLAISNSQFTNVFSQGVNTDQLGSGLQQVSINNSFIQATNNAVNAQLGASTNGDIQLAMNNSTFESRGNVGIVGNGVGGNGTLYVTQFMNNTVQDTSSTGSGGIVMSNVVFDSNPATAAFDTVNAGVTNIGTSGQRIQQDGIYMLDVSGDLNFGTLNMFVDGTGAGIRRLDTPLTLILDFIQNANEVQAADPFGRQLGIFNINAFGFNQNTQFAQVTNAILGVVQNAYLNIPTSATNANSPLPEGFQLDVDLLIGDLGVAPSNGATEYYYMGIGTTSTAGAPLGQATGIGNVRNPNAGTPNPNQAANGAQVGSVYTNNINGLANLVPANILTAAPGNIVATSNAVGGTVAHEFGHNLSLRHVFPGALTPNGNPPIMGTGASGLPNQARIGTREFSYLGTLSDPGTSGTQNAIQQLIRGIGLRDVANGTPIGNGMRVRNMDASADFTLNVNQGTINVTNGQAGIALMNVQSATIGGGGVTNIVGNTNNFAGVHIRQNLVPTSVTAPSTYNVNSVAFSSTNGSNQMGVDLRNDAAVGVATGALNFNANTNTFTFNNNGTATGFVVDANATGGIVNLGGSGNVQGGLGTPTTPNPTNGGVINGAIGF